MNSLLKNLSIRLVALFSALLLWFWVVLEKQFETSLTLPIRLINIPPALTPSEPFPTSAWVLVAGRGKDLLLLIFTHAELLVNCERVQRGTFQITLNSKNVEMNPETDVNILLVKDPPEMSVPFDAIVQKEVPVLPALNVSLGGGITQIGGATLFPNAAVISGPRVSVSKIEHLETRLQEVRGLSRDTVFFAFIERPDAYGVEVTPNKVKVTLRAAPIRKREIAGIPVKLIDVPPRVKARLDANTVSLVVAGPEEDVKNMRPELINVYVNYSRFSIEKQVEAEPTVSIIGNVEWSNLTPKTVRLIKE